MYRGSILLKEMFFPASGGNTSGPFSIPFPVTQPTQPTSPTRTGSLSQAPINNAFLTPSTVPALSAGSIRPQQSPPASTAVVGIMAPSTPVKQIEESSPSTPSKEITTPIATSGGGFGGGGGDYVEDPVTAMNGSSASGVGVQKSTAPSSITKKVITWILVIAAATAVYALLNKLSKPAANGDAKK